MTASERSAKYKRRHLDKGLCRNCPRPARPGTVLCSKCHITVKLARKRYLPEQRRVRAYRQQLGFCCYCKNQAEAGYAMCAHHIRLNREACRRKREKAAERRGWRLMKVKV